MIHHATPRLENAGEAFSNWLCSWPPGVEENARVVIFAETQLNWMVAAFATWFLKGQAGDWRCEGTRTQQKMRKRMMRLLVFNGA